MTARNCRYCGSGAVMMSELVAGSARICPPVDGCALARLPAKARSAFLMAHLEGLSYAEIAAQLDTSTHSVKKYLSKANLLCFFAVPDFAAS